MEDIFEIYWKYRLEIFCARFFFVDGERQRNDLDDIIMR